MYKLNVQTVLLELKLAMKHDSIFMARRKCWAMSLLFWVVVVFTFSFPGFWAIKPWPVYVAAVILLALVWYIVYGTIRLNYKKQPLWKLLLIAAWPWRYYMMINPRDWETVMFVQDHISVIDTNRDVVVFLSKRTAVQAKLMSMSS